MYRRGVGEGGEAVILLRASTQNNQAELPLQAGALIQPESFGIYFCRYITVYHRFTTRVCTWSSLLDATVGSIGGLLLHNDARIPDRPG